MENIEEQKEEHLTELKKLQSLREARCDEDVFELCQRGCNGDVTVVPRNLGCRHSSAAVSLLPDGLPPILPSNPELSLEEYLLYPEKLQIHRFHQSQRFWARKQTPSSLFNACFSPVLSTLKVERNAKTGELLGYQEVEVSNADSTGKNCASLQRLPDPHNSEVKGDSTNVPFRPGGLDETSVDRSRHEETPMILNFETDLLCIPPGFSQKVLFQTSDSDECSEPSVGNIADMLHASDLDEVWDESDDSPVSQDDIKEFVEENRDHVKKSDSLEKLFPQSEMSKEENVTETGREEDNQDWAVVVNVKDPVKQFRNIVPNMAREFPFELDNFQKQAVIHLENKECVFVAAHTSAGKTVVAEYAIALASKHMTKTIYTSPIKALSNQKFRDFKDTFESVGLITGDVQISPEANCLVMTTEILRSMLYRGSRIIRDVEWVIFDEVHYVNDAERGVVWEEVLIMLPEHVNIIMLSATVPNTKEFAGWVGRIKKKKVYVISTTKRPVPLEYFLYTGNFKKTSNELFKIVGEAGKFLETGYKKAVSAKRERGSKWKESVGAKGKQYKVNPGEERNIWMSLVGRLEATQGLPVVAFTFSRTRCNDNAWMLSGLDLTTSKEKHDIHIFIQKCVSRLKDQDAHLPQVRRMRELLSRGLAVHHSGILPILKEMIEMLFQRGLVKLLFATETFAMGVNMPTRTVVFDSIRKHDGTKFRELLPGEYIQMAGRAGRRGLDSTGTVIILCKGDVPELSVLNKMMMGKPTILESRFRLTYSMILNLLRSDDLSVVDMMKRSFAEFHLLKNAPEREKMIAESEEKLAHLTILTCSTCEVDIQDYYETCKDLARLTKAVQLGMTSSVSGQQALSSGRVIIINNEEFVNTLGIILEKKSSYSSMDSVRANKYHYVVFVVCNRDESGWRENKTSGVEDLVQPYVGKLEMACPERPCDHKIIMNVTQEDIAVITDHVIKVKSEAIISDYKNRQIPRFSNHPPGESTSAATEELLRIAESNRGGLPMMELTVKDVDLREKTSHLQLLRSRVEHFHCMSCFSFSEHFARYREERMLRDKITSLQEKSSVEMLTLIPEYRSRIQVLLDFSCLDNENVVKMHGLVACEINNHELVISTLLLGNFFRDFEPAEIVALFSCFVFEQKKCSEPTLTENLKKGKERIKQTSRDIATREQHRGMDISVEEAVGQFKFGLVEVVFEWANQMPFAEITQLTDVQEGIIVRCIQRLNELCQDVKNAAKKVGVVEVQDKMEAASALLKRDIVFAASLYTQ